ncbi:hypothetical protein G9A89_000052 [Geosiphon pyriformis]|nr:hypothetical protein G9A89_000052 [Geosiphon pyriformis]
MNGKLYSLEFKKFNQKMVKDNYLIQKIYIPLFFIIILFSLFVSNFHELWAAHKKIKDHDRFLESGFHDFGNFNLSKNFKINHNFTIFNKTLVIPQFAFKLSKVLGEIRSTKIFKRNILPETPAGENPEDYRIQIKNQRVLWDFKKYAYFANRAYCLSSSQDQISIGDYAKAILTPYNEIIVFIRVKGPDFNINDSTVFDTEVSPYIVKGLYVHQKLYDEYLKAENRLIQMVDDQLAQPKKRKRITFVGHGFGAGHAVFLALHYRRKIPELPITVYTFGQFRLGIDFFGEYVSKQLPNLYRITFGADIAPTYPRSPATGILSRYVHHHKEFWIPFAEGCDCLDDPQNPPIVYECFPNKEPYQVPNYESQYCLLAMQADIDERIASFRGPYLGETMGSPQNCEQLQDFPPFVNQVKGGNGH